MGTLPTTIALMFASIAGGSADARSLVKVDEVKVAAEVRKAISRQIAAFVRDPAAAATILTPDVVTIFHD